MQPTQPLIKLTKEVQGTSISQGPLNHLVFLTISYALFHSIINIYLKEKTKPKTV